MIKQISLLNSIGLVLKNTRKQKGLTQEQVYELAKKKYSNDPKKYLSFSTNIISRIENGKPHSKLSSIHIYMDLMEITSEEVITKLTNDGINKNLEYPILVDNNNIVSEIIQIHFSHSTSKDGLTLCLLTDSNYTIEEYTLAEFIVQYPKEKNSNYQDSIKNFLNKFQL